ncbi:MULTISPECIES: GTPase HflX [unclassified Bradyrhizobium]|uniref:GTPase HflX n=1 Tax=unclassified Bradyrhizobium TaxID=2631580 RepID=UPI0028E74959|nr:MULTISPECIES: GTPase HflX [unclassified Bradyrhizobium]
MEPRERNGGADRSRSADGQDPERVKHTGRVVVIGPYLRPRRGDGAAPQGSSQGLSDARDFEARLDEAKGLSRAIDLTVADAVIAPIGQIRPATYLGKGKVDEIGALIAGHGIELVVMDCSLAPIQQRNLEKAWNTKVLDRTGLILEIFGRRAKTKEGALQVELAHLNYQRSRLVRSWTHLERQRGGFGFMGGPGETQIEADRRLIGERITRLENELKKVQATRRLHRAGRQRVPYRVVALVGYTNAGKSTLFNRLTRADVQAADMLFATLDPTLRAISLPHGGKAMLSDTVGFISNLPTQLVAAFRATLEEVLEADVILHVRDISHEDAEAQQQDVEMVLSQLGIDPHASDNLIEVWNKIDRLDDDARENLVNTAARRSPERPCLLVSAETGEGVDILLQAIEDRLAAARITLDLSIDAADGAGISWLHRNAEVLDKELHDGRYEMTVRVDPSKRDIVVDRYHAVPRVA